MRADDQALVVPIATSNRQIEVPGEVGLDLEAELAPGLGDQIVGELLALAIALAGNADAVEGLAPNPLEQALGEADVGFDGRDIAQLPSPCPCLRSRPIRRTR